MQEQNKLNNLRPQHQKHLRKQIQNKVRGLEVKEIQHILFGLRQENRRLRISKGLSTDVFSNPEEVKEAFELDHSSGSCRLDQIQSILLGPSSSRFWLYRKEMNTMDMRKFKDGSKIPFYAWECLTINLSHREVNLVIRNEQDMDNLLKLIIYKTNSLNGKANTSIGI